MSGEKWTPAEDAVLIARFSNEKTADLARDMGMPTSRVVNRACRLGLKKSAAYLRSPSSGRLGHGQGEGHQFAKGMTPWNKGLKGVNGVSPTRFKKGNTPPQWRAVGSERITKDGVLVRKISDTGVKTADWRAVHVLVWEEHNGPVPDGMIVVFKDRNQEHRTIENLECITRAENMRRNSHYNRYPPEIAKLIQLRGALNRQINARKK